MNYLKIIKYLASLFAFIAMPSPSYASDDVELESAIIFNTSCAQCHEGECSGRLSYHLPKESMDRHIYRHGGTMSVETTQQLFILLRYMKEECRFYPLKISVEDQNSWGMKALARLHAPSGKAYFIPLGWVEPGLYRLLIHGLDAKTRVCIEIINSEFDFVIEENMDHEGRQKELSFQVKKGSDLFLRIKSHMPITLNRIELIEKAKSPD
ncbi:MAG: hypothetical protein EP297_12230 [Gammaproteobacteria bacterium]|nr:MAG: hypothetical protein EP297_12230 [Gammaproteobacteria bacterium]